jgi:hypothetical protein
MAQRLDNPVLRQPKPFWVPDYACLINKEQLTAICSGKIIADEEDLFRRIPNWDPSILGPELQSFLTKLRDAHRESVAPKKRKAVGPAPQKVDASGIVEVNRHMRSS